LPRASPTKGPGIALRAPATLGELAARLGGVVDPGAEGRSTSRLCPIDEAVAGDLAPLLSRRFLRAARSTEAALLVAADLADAVPPGRRWVHDHAALALARLLEDLAPPLLAHPRSTAHVDRLAEVHPTVSVGPGAVVMAGAVIRAGARVEPNAVVYGGVDVGARAVIGAGAVVGRPGFGWAASGAGVIRVPQLGGVRIEEDAEIGPLATVDAGTLGPTVIGRGAKLDAHVHVGHNAVIGPGSMVAAQAGFAGSARIGAGVLVGGQAGVADHVRVGDGARLAAKAGVIGDVAPGAVVAGYPAVDRARWLRSTARALAASGARTKKGPRG
jgi:UDP-3-O-[3-hydroxymyristoyl] glucosamine N-acyltransferase